MGKICDMSEMQILSAVMTLRHFLREKCKVEQTESGPFFTVSLDDVTVCNKNGDIIYETLDPMGIFEWEI